MSNSRREEHLQKLEDRLVVVDKVTRELMSDVIAIGCGRFRTLGTVAEIELDCLIDAGAWTDAALALVEFELPQWHVRRLVRDEGEWLCTLSRQPVLLLEFDEVAEARHQLLPVAILLALLQARRASGTIAAGMNTMSQDTGRRVTPYAAILSTSRAAWSEPTRQEPAVTALVIVLALLVFFCAAMLVPPLWTAIVESVPTHPSDRDCSVFESAVDRKACYEDHNVRTTRHPAKGANAPATLRL